MKIKLLKTIGIIGCLGIVGATPVMLTSCKKKSTSVAAAVVPQLKTSLKSEGSLNEFINTSSQLPDVTKNVTNIVNKSVSSIVNNWNQIPESEQKNIKLNGNIKGWENDVFDKTSLSEWEKNASITKMEWKGYQTDATDKVSFNTNKELKEFLDKNLTAIVKKSLSDTEFTNKTAALAKADIAVDENNGNLQVGVVVTDNSSTFRMLSSSQKEERVTTTNYVLEIPASSIVFNPTLEISGTYGNKQEISKTDVVLTYKVESIQQVEKVFVGEQAETKKVASLAEKENQESQIGLWKTVTDDGILKAIGWLDNNKTLGEEHQDGSDISVVDLKEDTIYADLGISKETDAIQGISINMATRNVEDSNFNGEYTIRVESFAKTKGDNDFSLKVNVYNVVGIKSTNDAKSNSTPLQINVPNAYIIDTTLDSGKYMNITKEFFGNESFEMGWKESGNGVDILKKNLENVKIFKKFIQKIEESSKLIKVPLYNGVIASYKSNQWTSAQDQGFKDTITFNLTLKKGFVFKKYFELTGDKNNKYNKEGKTLEVTFGIGLGNNQNEQAIWKNAQKSITEVAAGIN